MVNSNDPRWEEFYDFLDEYGFEEEDIYDAWFSPDM